MTMVPATSQIAVSLEVCHHRKPLSLTRSAVSIPSPSIRGTIMLRTIPAARQPMARESHPQRLRTNIISRNMVFIFLSAVLTVPARQEFMPDSKKSQQHAASLSRFLRKHERRSCVCGLASRYLRYEPCL